MDVFSVFYLFFNEKIMFNSQKIKSNHSVQRKNKVDTYGAPVLLLIITPLIAAKKFINSNKHSMYIRFI
jgi:hypothetical protein